MGTLTDIAEGSTFITNTKIFSNTNNTISPINKNIYNNSNNNSQMNNTINNAFIGDNRISPTISIMEENNTIHNRSNNG